MLLWTFGLHASFRIMFFSGYMPRNGIAGPYGNSVFRFWRILRNVLHGKCINLLSHQQCRRVRFSPPLLQCLSICRLLNTSHSDWCDVIPQCGFDLHSLLLVMLSIFSCGLLAICMSSLGKCLSRSPAGRYPRSWRRQWQAIQVFLPGEWIIGWS